MEPEEKRNEDRCECHDKDNSQPTGRIVVLKLIIAAGLGILFMVIEFTGIYIIILDPDDDRRCTYVTSHLG